MSPLSPVLELRDAAVRLGGVEILRRVTLAFPPACVTGLAGPNGAGKSTLLRSACGLVPLASGQALLDGRPVSAMSRRRLAAAVHLLPQNVQLSSPFTVREVVGMGRHPHLGRFTAPGPRDREIVEWAMEQTGVADLASRPVTQLSGGERQRALLARSLATEAPVLLLDEPTANLDILHQLEVMELLKGFAAQGKTVVAVLHDLNQVRKHCGHAALLGRGCVAAVGLPSEALNVENVEKVFGVSARTSGEDGHLAFSLPPRRN
ncbi:MAG TPA: ABC transporter ATP-binding protein [Candidatus Brocadiia bacterium]|nr:ABC transporter ATP-binding protein [Candidatus Brocadiia bacterium]